MDSTLPTPEAKEMIGEKKIAPEAQPSGAGAEAVEGAGEKAPEWIVDPHTRSWGLGRIYDVVVAIKNGYLVKDRLKEMGYQWEKHNKVWFKFVNIKQLPQELERLKELGVRAADPDPYLLIAAIHSAMRAALRRLARDYGYKLKEEGHLQFMLEPSIYLQKSVEAAEKNPAKKARSERRLKRLLRQLSEFAEVEYDPETMKITVAYPKPPATTRG